MYTSLRMVNAEHTVQKTLAHSFLLSFPSAEKTVKEINGWSLTESLKEYQGLADLPDFNYFKMKMLNILSVWVFGKFRNVILHWCFHQVGVN